MTKLPPLTAAVLAFAFGWLADEEEKLIFPRDPEFHPIQLLEDGISGDGLDYYTYWEAKNFREELIRRLFAVVKSPNTGREPGGKMDEAMWILGEYRTDREEILSELAKRLTYEARGEDLGDVGMLYCFPAAWALFEVGAKSRPHLVQVIVNEESSLLHRRLAAWTLVQIQEGENENTRLSGGTEDDYNEDQLKFSKSQVNAYLDHLIGHEGLFDADARQRLADAKQHVNDYRFVADVPENVISNYEREDPWAE
jgi:hypothetical protein